MVHTDKLGKKALAIREQAWDQLRQIKTSGLNLIKSGLDLIKKFFGLIRIFFAWIYYQLVIAGYFLLWSYKTEIRAWLRDLALVGVSFSTLMLSVEIIVELVGHKSLLRFITWLSGPRAVELIGRVRSLRFLSFLPLPDSPHLVKIAWLVFLVASGGYLAWHNVKEARKPDYEFHFARAISSFLLDCRIARANKQLLSMSEALKFCHFIFEHAGIRHVALHLVEAGVLSIRPEHIYPRNEKLLALLLQPGEGVAGEVYKDDKLHLQYVPRLFFPFNRRYGGWLFPHSVKFQFNRDTVPNTDTDLRLWQVGNEEINPDVFKRGTGPILYRSFLSVPVFSVSDKALLGVLSLDFSKTDALDTADIAMSLVFVLLLAGEMRSGNIALINVHPAGIPLHQSSEKDR